MKQKRGYIVFIFLLLATNYNSKAQGDIDSLIKAEQNYKTKDARRLSFLIKLANEYIQRDPIVGIKMSFEAIQIAADINDDKALADAYLCCGNCYKEFHKTDSAMFYLQKAFQLYSKHHIKKGQAEVYAAIARVFYLKENYVSAIQYYEKALLIYRLLNDEPGIAITCSDMALFYEQVLEDSEKARLYEAEAMAIFTKLNDYRIASVYSNIGLRFSCRDRYDSALIYHSKAAQIAEKFKQQSALAVYLNYIAWDYSGLNNFPRAYNYAQKSLLVNSSINRKAGIAFSFLCLGSWYMHAPDKYLKFQNKSPQQRFPLALFYYKQAVKLYQEIHTMESQAHALQRVSETFEKMGRWDSAHSYYKKAIEIYDSVDVDEQVSELRRIEAKYELTKRNDSLSQTNRINKLELKQNKLLLRQQWLLSGLSLLLIISVSGFFFYRNFLQRKNLKTELSLEKAVQQKVTAEHDAQMSTAALNLLRAQMNPHFIFNCLNSIKLYTQKSNNEAATNYLTKFSRLMRLVLENSKSERITLQQEIETIQLYIEMEGMRFKEKLRYEIIVDETADPDYTEIPPMLIQPYVENAIWHGLMHKEEGGLIRIHISEQEDILKVSIEDNGVGRLKSEELKNKAATKHKSFGMAITGERLNIINQRYSTNIGVVVNDLFKDNTPVGTEVVLAIPVL